MRIREILVNDNYSRLQLKVSAAHPVLAIGSLSCREGPAPTMHRRVAPVGENAFALGDGVNSGPAWRSLGRDGPKLAQVQAPITAGRDSPSPSPSHPARRLWDFSSRQACHLRARPVNTQQPLRSTPNLIEAATLRIWRTQPRFCPSAQHTPPPRHGYTPHFASGQKGKQRLWRFRQQPSSTFPWKQDRAGLTVSGAHRTAWVLSMLGELVCHRHQQPAVCARHGIKRLNQPFDRFTQVHLIGNLGSRRFSLTLEEQLVRFNFQCLGKFFQSCE